MVHLVCPLFRGLSSFGVSFIRGFTVLCVSWCRGTCMAIVLVAASVHYSNEARTSLLLAMMIASHKMSMN